MGANKRTAHPCPKPDPRRDDRTGRAAATDDTRNAGVVQSGGVIWVAGRPYHADRLARHVGRRVPAQKASARATAEICRATRMICRATEPPPDDSSPGVPSIASRPPSPGGAGAQATPTIEGSPGAGGWESRVAAADGLGGRRQHDSRRPERGGANQERTECPCRARRTFEQARSSTQRERRARELLAAPIGEGRATSYLAEPTPQPDPPVDQTATRSSGPPTAINKTRRHNTTRDSAPAPTEHERTFHA